MLPETTTEGTGDGRHLIVGLGNPGREYVGTKHNVGFEVARILVSRHRGKLAHTSLRADIAEISIDGRRTLVACPTTYMNASGEAVGAICRYYKILPSEIIVVLDDVALPVGKIRLRLKGSAGGHNGLANIAAILGTLEIPRIRVGVGGAPPGGLVNHVLSRFRAADLEEMEHAYLIAADAVECAVTAGFELAMNRYNVAPS